MSGAAFTIRRLKAGVLPAVLVAVCTVVFSGCGEAASEEKARPRRVSSSSAALAALGDELEERDGGFSYRMPRGWKSVDSRSSRFLVASGPDVGGYEPNITASRERAPLRFESYVARSRASIGKLMEGAVLQQDSAFTTASGLKGRRWIVHNEAEGRKLWHAFYLFPGEGDDKLMLTVSHTRAAGPGLLPVFDAAMKTFSLR